MGTRERRQREREALRQLILETARDLFAAEGSDAVTMRRIASAIEYSPTAIYLHFRDKDSLIRELCDRDLLGLRQQLAGIVRIADPIERLRRAAYLYLQFGMRNPNQYRSTFMTADPKAGGDDEAYAFLRSIAAEAVEHGLFRGELRDPDLIAQTVWAGVHGVIALEISKRQEGIDWRPADDRCALMIDTLIAGLSPAKR